MLPDSSVTYVPDYSESILLPIRFMTETTGHSQTPNRTEGSRLPMAVCAAAAELLVGSHEALEDLFYRAGAVGPPPALAHHSKWKTWLFECGRNPAVDSLGLLGHLIEEFMDLPPLPTDPSVGEFFGGGDPVASWKARRVRLGGVLEQAGLRYFPGGRVLPLGTSSEIVSDEGLVARIAAPRKPESVEELLRQLIRGLPRAMHPLIHRRRNAQALSFDSEYDLQDMLHSQLRPWISDIRPEEFTPSYAGSSTRMDFLLPEHELVLELKRVRSRDHAARVGEELIIDREHYRRHPQCKRLWCVIYDPALLLKNPAGIVRDLKGTHVGPEGRPIDVEVFVFGPAQ